MGSNKTEENSTAELSLVDNNPQTKNNGQTRGRAQTRGCASDKCSCKFCKPIMAISIIALIFCVAIIILAIVLITCKTTCKNCCTYASSDVCCMGVIICFTVLAGIAMVVATIIICCMLRYRVAMKKSELLCQKKDEDFENKFQNIVLGYINRANGGNSSSNAQCAAHSAATTNVTIPDASMLNVVTSQCSIAQDGAAQDKVDVKVSKETNKDSDEDNKTGSADSDTKGCDQDKGKSNKSKKSEYADNTGGDSTKTHE